MIWDVYLTFRLPGGALTEEHERVSAATAAAALELAAGRWPLRDAGGMQCRWPAGHQVWQWDGQCQTLTLTGGTGAVVFA